MDFQHYDLMKNIKSFLDLWPYGCTYPCDFQEDRTAGFPVFLETDGFAGAFGHAESAANASVQVELGLLVYHFDGPDLAAVKADFTAHAGVLINHGKIAALHSFGGFIAHFKGIHHAATITATGADGPGVFRVKRLDHHGVFVAEFQNFYCLVHADLTAHAVFDIVIGCHAEQHACFDGFIAELVGDFSNHGPADAVGHSDFLLPFKDGNGIVIGCDRPGRNQFGVDGNGTLVGVSRDARDLTNPLIP